jgi:hypothetical protein
MTRPATRLFITLGLTVSAAGIANAQTGPGSAAPLPGTGDSTKISAGNRANNAEYNHLIGSGEPSPTKPDERRASRHAAVPATAADLKAGSALRDVKGVPLGTIASVDADGAVVDTGTTKIKVPVVAFGKDDKGLLLGITAARFAELVAAAKVPN